MLQDPCEVQGHATPVVDEIHGDSGMSEVMHPIIPSTSHPYTPTQQYTGQKPEQYTRQNAIYHSAVHDAACLARSCHQISHSTSHTRWVTHPPGLLIPWSSVLVRACLKLRCMCPSARSACCLPGLPLRWTYSGVVRSTQVGGKSALSLAQYPAGHIEAVTHKLSYKDCRIRLLSFTHAVGPGATSGRGYALYPHLPPGAGVCSRQ
jgi:hypothetical protein